MALSPAHVSGKVRQESPPEVYRAAESQEPIYNIQMFNPQQQNQTTDTEPIEMDAYEEAPSLEAQLDPHLSNSPKRHNLKLSEMVTPTISEFKNSDYKRSTYNSLKAKRVEVAMSNTVGATGSPFKQQSLAEHSKPSPGKNSNKTRRSSTSNQSRR